MRSIYKNYLIRCLYIIIDLGFIYTSFFVACFVRQQKIPFNVEFSSFLFDPRNPFTFIFVFWMATTVLYLHSNGLYHTRREVFEPIEIWLVMKSIFLSSLITIVMIFAVKVDYFPRTIIAISVVCMSLTLSFWRFIKRIFVGHLVSMGYNNFNVLVIGAGKIGTSLREEIQKNPHLGLKVVGFLDDFKRNDADNKNIILGKISDFPKVVQREFIDKVFITIHHDSSVFLNLLEQARDLRVSVRVIPQGFDLVLGKFSKFNIGFIPVLEYSNAAPLKTQFGKRVFDLFFSTVGMVFLLPVFIVLSILIKLDSKGPIFYVSKRYGRLGRCFNMYKFRSMRMDAEKMIDDLKKDNEVDGPIFKIKDDPRVTKLGRFLRKYSLDELPQLFNVLKGEMSLVGPRPLPIDQIHKEDLLQLKRLEVKPGITGLWQIRGRSDISFTRLVKWDIWYINNWSFWLDVNILLQTIPVVCKAKGAY